MSIKLIGAYYTCVLIKSIEGKVQYTFCPKWWDRNDLVDKYPFQEIYEDCYFTYSFETTLQIFHKIHRKEKINLMERLFANEFWGNSLLAECSRMDDFFLQSNDSEFVVAINLIEWESGY